MAIKIKTLEIAGFTAAVKALRLPFSKECRSKSQQGIIIGSSNSGKPSIEYLSQVDFDPKDLHLMSVLVKRGDEHAKVIRGIVVYAEIEAPRFWWQEMDTYRIGAEKLSSESTMHTLGEKPLTVDNFSVSDVIKECLTPKEIPSTWNTKLHFDTPEELKSVIIERYGRRYEVWNNGEIYALEFTSIDLMPNGTVRERVFPKTKLKIGHTRSKGGYFQVGIGGKKGKIEMVHRIMAEAFVPNPDNKPFVNHKDGDKGNCSPSNLEWCTSQENNSHARMNGLNKSTIRAKYLAYKNGLKYTDDDVTSWVIMKESGMTYEEIAAKVNVPKSVIENYILYDGGYKVSPYRSAFKEAHRLEGLIETINELASLYNETKEASLLYDIKALMPESFIQKRIEAFSYQCLRNIVKQRKGHRLPEWATFIHWVKSLPFAEELILVGLEEQE